MIQQSINYQRLTVEILLMSVYTRNHLQFHYKSTISNSRQPYALFKQNHWVWRKISNAMNVFQLICIASNWTATTTVIHQTKTNFTFHSRPKSKDHKDERQLEHCNTPQPSCTSHRTSEVPKSQRKEIERALLNAH